MASRDHDTIAFGGFVLSRDAGLLSDRSGAERSLRPKSYRVLELLAERQGRIVSKDELVREAWPGVFVSDDSLAQCISDIRKALGAEGASLLRTVPRRGYMLVGSPLQRGPAKVMGRRAQVALAALVMAAALAGLWRTAGTQPPMQVSAPVHAVVAEAEAMLKEMDWRRRENNDRARQLLEPLLADEPQLAAAWALLGATYWREVLHLPWGGGRLEMAKALELVERSVALGGDARAYQLLAEMRLLAPFPEMRSSIDALAFAQVAVRLEPESADALAVLAEVLALTGRPEEAVEMIRKARRVSADPPDWYGRIAGLALLFSGKAASAAEELGPVYGAGTFSGERLYPGWFFAASLAHAGRVDEARAVVRNALERRPEETLAAVAQSLDAIEAEADRALIIDGLRLAGFPD